MRGVDVEKYAYYANKLRLNVGLETWKWRKIVTSQRPHSKYKWPPYDPELTPPMKIFCARHCAEHIALVDVGCRASFLNRWSFLTKSLQLWPAAISPNAVHVICILQFTVAGNSCTKPGPHSKALKRYWSTFRSAQVLTPPPVEILWYHQGRKEVRWRPGQEAILPPPCSKQVFQKQIYCTEDSICDIVGTFRHSPQWFGVHIVTRCPGICPPAWYHTQLRFVKYCSKQQWSFTLGDRITFFVAPFCQNLSPPLVKILEFLWALILQFAISLIVTWWYTEEHATMRLKRQVTTVSFTMQGQSWEPFSNRAQAPLNTFVLR